MPKLQCGNCINLKKKKKKDLLSNRTFLVLWDKWQLKFHVNIPGSFYKQQISDKYILDFFFIIS